MKLSENFLLEEFEYSNKAIELSIKNKAPDSVVSNLKAMCEGLLEILRKDLNSSIKISSGYRCSQLNKAVGGRPNSKHILGQAADIYVDKFSAFELFNYIKNNKDKFDYDQLIFEKSGAKRWVHISYVNPEKNRKQDLILSV